MLFLKEANFDDIEKEYLFITTLPENENGFINPDFNVSKINFKDNILPLYINHSKGINLPDGWIPYTTYFLWNDNEIVGLFRIRHYLNETLKRGTGHIAYGIDKPYRGKGFATEGLKLAIEKAWEIIPEDEIYMSVHKDNPASLKVQIKNGAYVHHEDEKELYTRIKKSTNNSKRGTL